MRLLKYLFGSKRKTDLSETEIGKLAKDAEQTETVPPIDLFIDNEAPKSENSVGQSQSKLTLFLNRDYHSIGIHDGYEYHSQETLEIATKVIRAEFQLIIDQSIQEKLESKLLLKNMIVDVKKIFDDARQKLENTLNELDSSLAILQKQKDLSAESEGWIMTAIHSYQQGFILGLNDWLDGEQLLTSIKNF